MPSPNLPSLLKRLAITQMGLAQQFAKPELHDPTARTKLLEESIRINSDLDALIAEYRIDVTKRTAKHKTPCKTCGN